MIRRNGGKRCNMSQGPFKAGETLGKAIIRTFDFDRFLRSGNAPAPPSVVIVQAFPGILLFPLFLTFWARERSKGSGDHRENLRRAV